MIGGNTKGILQVNIPGENRIGEPVPQWHDVIELPGFLDLSAGDSRYTHNAKMQESTHVFVGDYKPIPAVFETEGKSVRVSPENTRFVANSQRYDVMLIDDPMELHLQLEIYLKYTGGQ